MGPPENSGTEETPREKLSKEEAEAIRSAEYIFDVTETEAKRGNIAVIAFEQYVQEVALLDAELVAIFSVTRDAPKAFANELTQRWRRAVVPSDACIPPLFKVDGPGGCLHVYICRIYFARFLSAVVGSRAHIDRIKRIYKPTCICDGFSAAQMFKPRRSQTPIEHAVNAKRCIRGQ